MSKRLTKVVILGVLSVFFTVFSVWVLKYNQEHNYFRLTEKNQVFQTKKDAKKEISIYVSIYCPHCRRVEEFVKEENLEKRLNIHFKEVSQNKDYAKELIDRGLKCSNIPRNFVGAVPLLVDGKNCVLGDTPIIDYLKEKVKQTK